MKNYKTAIYFNKWKNFECPEIRDLFRKLTFDEVKALKAGDRVWIDTDPIHLLGKVDGFIEFTVNFIRPCDDGFTIHYFNEEREGHRMIEEKGSVEGFYVVTDIKKLNELLAANPAAAEVY